jgi:putative MATE family efflux protein
LGALLAEPLFLLADAAIVGHLGTPELAGVSVAAAILGTAVSLCMFLAYGTTGAVARQLGAGDLAGAMRHGVDGMWLGALLGCALAALVAGLADQLVTLFDIDAEATEHAVAYLRISALGLPSVLIVLAATGVLRGLQDTRTPLLVAVAAAMANVCLNLALVYGLSLGVSGSATGTVIAQTGAALVYTRVVTSGARSLGVPVGADRRGIARSFTASAPLVVRNLSLRAVIALAAVVAARLGEPEVAAHQVAFTIWSTLALALDSIAIAGQALVGRYLGAADVRGAREATGRMVELAIGLGALLGLVLLITRAVIPPLFSPDAEVQRLLASTLLIAALMQPFAGWVFALDGALLGAGDVRYIAASQVVTVIVFAPLALAVSMLDGGLFVLWCAIAVWVFTRLALMAWRTRGTAWAVAGPARA